MPTGDKGHICIESHLNLYELVKEFMVGRAHAQRVSEKSSQKYSKCCNLNGFAFVPMCPNLLGLKISLGFCLVTCYQSMCKRFIFFVTKENVSPT